MPSCPWKEGQRLQNSWLGRTHVWGWANKPTAGMGGLMDKWRASLTTHCRWDDGSPHLLLASRPRNNETIFSLKGFLILFKINYFYFLDFRFLYTLTGQDSSTHSLPCQPHLLILYQSLPALPRGSRSHPFADWSPSIIMSFIHWLVVWPAFICLASLSSTQVCSPPCAPLFFLIHFSEDEC